MTASRNSRSLAATVGASIKRARTAAGLTQHELALRMGDVDPMAVSRWERGVNRPSDVHLLMLSDALGREISWFYETHTEAAA